MPDDKPLDDVWTTRDFPVLARAVAAIDRGEFPHGSTIASELDMSVDDVRLALRALGRRGFVAIQEYLGGGIVMHDVSGAAYLIPGLHPDGDDTLEQLASALRQAAEKTADPDEKGRLRKAASAVGDLIGEVRAGVMTAYLTSLLPP